MTKKKSFISLVLAFCLAIPAMFMLTACGGNNAQTLKSPDGIAVVGEFEKGAELKTDKVEITDADEILNALKGESIEITNTSNAIIYDIFVSKDGKEVEPNGKVTVSVPVKANEDGYKVFHIKDDDTIETLASIYKDGILTFETSSFSYYVIVPTGDVTMNSDPSDPTPDTGDDTPTAETIWTNAINYWQAQTNVKVVEKTVTPQSYDEAYGNMGARFTIHEYNGTAISILTYAENVAKGSKPSTILEKNDETYSHYETSDDGTTWNKETPSWAKGEYDDELACRVYGWRDPGSDYGLSTSVVDFSYSNFEYDETKGAYTSKDGKEITVEFKFESNTLTKIVITKGNATNNQTTRTITFGDAVVTIPTVAGSEAEWDSAINTWQNANNVKVFERSTTQYDNETEVQITICQIQNDAYSYIIYDEKEGEGSKPSWYIVKDSDNYFYYGNDDGDIWYKTSEEHTKDLYDGALRNIYECSDLNDKKIEFSYEKFDYDSSTSTYKYKANNNITVKLNFVDGKLNNIVITRIDDSTTYVRTITFDAVVEVPTENVIDNTVSE